MSRSLSSLQRRQNRLALPNKQNSFEPEPFCLERFSHSSAEFQTPN